jgi:lipoprotein LprG
VNPRIDRVPIVGLVLLLLVAACTSDAGGDDSRSVGEVLAAAKKNFDEAQSVHLTLATESEPSSGNGVLGADGTLTHQPAFEGTVNVLLGGFNAEVPVVSVDEQVHAKLPLTTSYEVIKPSEYGSPDPADFADPEAGISGLLLELQDPTRSGEMREGEKVLTSYTGTLPGSFVDRIIPSADADGTYQAVVGIDDEDRLTTVRMTGDFFSGGGDETYDMTFDAYDENVTIAVP